MLGICGQCLPACGVCVKNVYGCVTGLCDPTMSGYTIHDYMAIWLGRLCTTRLSPGRLHTLTAKLFWGCCFVSSWNTELVNEKCLTCVIVVAIVGLQGIRRYICQDLKISHGHHHFMIHCSSLLLEVFLFVWLVWFSFGRVFGVFFFSYIYWLQGREMIDNRPSYPWLLFI